MSRLDFYLNDGFRADSFLNSSLLISRQRTRNKKSGIMSQMTSCEKYVGMTGIETGQSKPAYEVAGVIKRGHNRGLLSIRSSRSRTSEGSFFPHLDNESMRKVCNAVLGVCGVSNHMSTYYRHTLEVVLRKEETGASRSEPFLRDSIRTARLWVTTLPTVSLTIRTLSAGCRTLRSHHSSVGSSHAVATSEELTLYVATHRESGEEFGRVQATRKGMRLGEVGR